MLPAIAAEVRQIIKARMPSSQQTLELRDDRELGEGGVGLDSIALFEVLLECEKRWGVAVTDTLYDQRPLTVGKLVAHLSRPQPA
jgi:acyl carrier protein